MKYLNIVVWVVLLAEVLAFGRNDSAHIQTAVVLAAQTLLWLLLSHTRHWNQTMDRLAAANPVSPVILRVLIWLLTILAVAFPYISGSIPHAFFIFVGLLWMGVRQ